jgi:amidase
MDVLERVATKPSDIGAGGGNQQLDSICASLFQRVSLVGREWASTLRRIALDSTRGDFMSIPRPSKTQLADLATRIGYDISSNELDEYLAMMGGMLNGYDAVDAIEDDRPPCKYPTRSYSFPSPQENPHNAWYVKTSLNGATHGALRGKRIAIKDSIAIAEVPMMNGSSLLEGYIADIDATVVTRVLDAGGDIIGKTHCEYFCLSGGSHTNATGPVHNPHRHGYSAGGSSSGSAVVLVTGEADLALGADQGGSIRMPSSFSGTVGMKPTYSLVPYTGLAPIEATIDHVGPMTMNVRDNAMLLEAIAGPDAFDPRQLAVRVTPYVEGIDRGVRGMKIALVREGFGLPSSEADVDAKVRAAAKVFERLGARVDEISLPAHAQGGAAWTPVGIDGLTATVLTTQGFGIGRLDYYMTSMMEWLHARRDRINEVPPNIKLFTLVGRYIIERYGYAYYGRGVNRVRTVRRAYDAALAGYDALLMPTTPMKAQPLPDPGCSVTEWCKRGTEMLANTCPTDVTHHPAISVPCAMSDGLPVGLMLIGKHFDEATLYRLAHAFEQSGDWRER